MCKKTLKRKVSAKRREDRVVAAAANDCWSMDFLSDQLFDGRKVRVLTVVDNGPEFISKKLDLWAWMHRVELDFSRPEKPTDNAFAESLIDKLRAVCLNAYWILSLDDARLKCEAWRRDYNEVRPHSAIGNQTPMAWAFASDRACLT